MKKISFLFFIVLLSLNSCTDIKKIEQLEKIEVINNSLDSLSQVYTENKIDSVQNMSMSIYGVQNRIKNNYTSDTINFQLGVKMGKHKWMKKKLKVVASDGKILDGEISEAISNLSDLKHDIENGYGEREKYDDHISHEKKKFKQLKFLCDEYVELKDSCLSIYNNVHDELNAFSMSLIQNK